jgi:AGCS family alanine or glycine:cation symporter
MAELSDFIWEALVYILVGFGIFFTLASRFTQVRHFTRMFHIFRDKTPSSDGVSSLEAVILSIGGRVGSGNIIGVAVAITLGGPGAVFWMWVTAVLGMATSYYESTLAQLFKRKEGDEYRGGPQNYIRYGLGKKWNWLAALYAGLLLITFGFAFNIMQSFSLAASFEQSFGMSPLLTGSLLTILVAGVIFGGVKRIVSFTDFMVPIMAVGYVGVALYVIVTNISELPSAIYSIFESAFGFNQAVAGGVGAAISFGVSRGLFSNEAGLGSTTVVAAAANVAHPTTQGSAQALGVFVDTIVICTATAAIILMSDIYSPGSDIGGLVLTQQAMGEHLGGYASQFVSLALFFFIITSIMYNYYLGETAIDYFSGKNKMVFLTFRLSLLAFIFWGAQQDLETVLGFANLSMGILALVNLFALAMLFKVAKRVLADFDTQVKQGVDIPVLDVEKFADLDIDHNAWPKKQ